MSDSLKSLSLGRWSTTDDVDRVYAHLAAASQRLGRASMSGVASLMDANLAAQGYREI